MGKRKTGRPTAGHGQRPAPATAAADPRQQLAALVSAYQHGRYEEVVRGARRFTRAWPDQVVGWNLLAEGHRLAGRLDEAEAACQRALAVAPRSAEAHNNRGNLLRDRGDHPGAESAYRKALSIRPDLAEAHFNLANLLRTDKRLVEAVSAYRSAIARRPDEHLYHYALGCALLELDDHEAAQPVLETAARLRPEHADTQVELGRVLRELNELDAARAACERAIEMQPDLARAHANLGAVHRVMGDFDAAEQSLRRALAIREDYAWAWYLLATARRLTTAGPDLSIVERMLERAPPDSEERIQLNFALGQAHSNAGSDADTIFGFYREGCALKRKTLDYDVAESHRLFEAIAAAFSADWMARVATDGDPTEAPVFIVGMPRSGTTLVEQILASHPRVHGAGECPDLGRLVASKSAATGRPYPEWVPDMPAEELALLGAHYRRRVIEPAAPATRVVDKMPANFQYLGLLAKALPRARVIHLQRDPVDTCLSCYMQLFNRSQHFSYDLRDLGSYYRAYVELMAHWRAVLPHGFMLDFPYEALIDDPEPRVRRLLDHCGLDWDPACLDFHRTKRAVRTASLAQVRQPLYRGSVGNWHKYRAHLDPLIEALGPLAATGSEAR